MTSRITEATIYVSGALLTRSQSFKLKAGRNSVSFEKLPSNMDVRSIVVEADDLTILSVSHGSSYSPEGFDGAERIKDLTKRLEILRNELERENKIIYMLEMEEQLLRTNSSIGSGKEFRASDVKESVTFFHDRMISIFEERMERESKRKELSMEISSIQSEIGIDQRSRQSMEIIVDVFSEGDMEAELRLSYFTPNARWVPCYDIRAKSTDGPISLHSKAMVHQSTGEDWKEISIVLSTGNPSFSGNIPELCPWYLNFDAPVVNQYQSFNASAKESRVMVDACMECSEPECEVVSNNVVLTEGITSIEYALKAPYSIESSDKGRSVDIASYEMPATFVYKSVRKLEKEVFLLAEVEGWEGLNLIEGVANIFFEGKYVGETLIDPRRTGKALALSLGRDRNVVVTRIKGKDFTSKPSFGNNVKVSREWTLTAKNLKKQRISMVLEDQIPVSVNKGLIVDPVEISGATLDKGTGKLVWRLELDPAESKSMLVKYEVTHPKGETVRLD